MEVLSEQLKARTQRFAVTIIELCRLLPKTDEARIIGRQLLRAATSVAANYRATRRARSRAEFIAKMGVVVEEADETVFWIELLCDAGIVSAEQVRSSEVESKELLAIFAAAYHPSRQHRGT